jgi:hypothetical protein
MAMSSNLPPVARCEVTDCFYNRDTNCHAPAINIGGEHPNCDTFIPTANHISRMEQGMVGACHVNQCKWNQDLTCHAANIVVAHHNLHADCETYTPVK